MVLYEYTGRRRWIFRRAWFSFWATVSAIVIAFALVAPDRWFADDAAAVASSTYVWPHELADREPTPHAAFAKSAYAVRFFPDDRAEVRVGNRFVNGYYRVENNRVVVETVDSREGNKALAFKLDGNRLVQGDMVLYRANR
ncbi:MAG: hypothetical protein D6781_13420 [Verrucomicrobia bacterium]|nr:MAG: hypothetical protein D6781_13420 [Verrucomicrobiota bacterium]